MTEELTKPGEDNVATHEPMLSEKEARILGALMEKQLTTPDAYPLTLNSLVTACNQKTSREPVMNLTNGEVQHCLNLLQERDLIDIDYGSRADKYQQKLTRSLHFDSSEQAVYSLMLLRGAQTVNELYSRSQRMAEFDNAQGVKELLDHHTTKLKPLAKLIPAQAGQREDRFVQLLTGEPDLSQIVNNQSITTSKNSGSISELSARVEALEQQVALLLERTS